MCTRLHTFFHAYSFVSIHLFKADEAFKHNTERLINGITTTSKFAKEKLEVIEEVKFMAQFHQSKCKPAGEASKHAMGGG